MLLTIYSIVDSLLRGSVCLAATPLHFQSVCEQDLEKF